MARVNITVPDELLGQARAAGLNVSRLAAAALAEELDRRAKVAELDAEFGPVPPEELAAAAQWADRIAPEPGAAAAGRIASRSARRARSA